MCLRANCSPISEARHLIVNDRYDSVDITNFTVTPVGGKEIKKFIMSMFKLCADIKKMMSISGTHDSDPMSYVDRAKERVGGGLHRLSLYFFYVKCKDTPRVDDEFIVGMPDDLKGSSTHPDSTESIDLTDQLVAHTVVSRSLKTKQQTLDTSTAAFQSITTMLTTKEAREAR
jgi:hypothetical protein